MVPSCGFPEVLVLLSLVPWWWSLGADQWSPFRLYSGAISAQLLVGFYPALKPISPSFPLESEFASSLTLVASLSIYCSNSMFGSARYRPLDLLPFLDSEGGWAPKRKCPPPLQTLLLDLTLLLYILWASQETQTPLVVGPDHPKDSDRLPCFILQTCLAINPVYRGCTSWLTLTTNYSL